MGFCKEIWDGIPRPKNKKWGCLFLILNILIPGIGTIFAVIKYNSPCNQFLFGLFQLLLSGAVIGYVFSIIWGIRMYCFSVRNSKLKVRNKQALRKKENIEEKKETFQNQKDNINDILQMNEQEKEKETKRSFRKKKEQSKKDSQGDS